MEKITKSKFRINNIIEFVHKAMNDDLKIKAIDSSFNDMIYYSYYIENSTNDYVYFYIEGKFSDPSIKVSLSNSNGYLEISTPLNKRDILDLNALLLDVQEYNEEKTIKIYNNFFSNEISVTNINNLLNGN